MKDRGEIDKIKGKAEEVVGDISGNKKKKAKGVVDQAIGKTKEVTSDLKDKAESVTNELKNEHHK